MQVTIYIETTMHGPAIRKGAGEWLIEYIRMNGEPETRQGIILKESTTENALNLELINEAISKLTKSCSVRVNTQCEHILNVTQNYWLSQWEKNDWRNAKGKPVKNAELWQQCRELIEKHTVSFGKDNNSYKTVMQNDLEKEMEK